MAANGRGRPASSVDAVIAVLAVRAVTVGTSQSTVVTAVTGYRLQVTGYGERTSTGELRVVSMNNE